MELPASEVGWVVTDTFYGPAVAGPGKVRALAMLAGNSPGPTRYVAALFALGQQAETSVLNALEAGSRRFNELAAELSDVPEPELSNCLRELDAGGFVVRRVEPGPPLRVIYELSALGQELAPALARVRLWSRRAQAQ